MPRTILDREDLLRKLIAFDTTSSKPNRACVDFIRDYLDGFGIATEIVTGGEGKACLWATIGASAAPGIVLAGHTDTVPVEGQSWSSDPFTLTERDGKFYARGSADMKGFIACAIAAVTSLDAAKLKQPIHLAFTHDEETDMSGAARLTDHLKARGVKPAWVWIGEPTLLRMVDAHKGVAAWRTEITGVAAHSGYPDNGLNAISLGARFIDIIERVAETKKNNPQPGSRFRPPYTTFNIGMVKGGTAENIIAEHCDILWQARAHPGDPLPPILAEIERAVTAEIAPRLARFPGRAKFRTCTCFDIPPLTPTADNPGQKCLGALSGRAETESVSFATEAGFFQSLGTHAIVCGPGSIEMAHQADEYVDKAQLAACHDLILRVATSA